MSGKPVAMIAHFSIKDFTSRVHNRAHFAMALLAYVFIIQSFFTQTVFAQDTTVVLGDLTRRISLSCQEIGSIGSVLQTVDQATTTLTDTDLESLLDRFQKRIDRRFARVERRTRRIERLRAQRRRARGDRQRRRALRREILRERRQVRQQNTRITNDQSLRAGVLACDRGEISDEPEQELSVSQSVPEFSSSGTFTGSLFGKCEIVIEAFAGEAFGSLPPVASVHTGSLRCTIDSVYNGDTVEVSATSATEEGLVIFEATVVPLVLQEQLGVSIKTFSLNLCSEDPACSEAFEARQALLEGSLLLHFEATDETGLSGDAEFGEPGT